MTEPSRRAVLAAAGAGLSLPLAGCLGPSAPTPPGDCGAVERPSPTLPQGAPEDAVAPADYPEPPADAAAAAQAAYVESFERAYRRNAVLAGTDGTVTAFGVQVTEDPTTEAGPHDGTYVRLRYTYFATIETDDGVLEVDSAEYAAAYFVDEAVAVRAIAEGQDADSPAPLESGTLVACRD